MSKILHIICSPRGQDSKSNLLALKYIDSLYVKDVNCIDAIDLWQEGLPEFDGDKAAAKMTFFGVGEMEDKTQTAWDQIVDIIQRFISADHYVFGLPMWNGGVPYKLKQYIDIITQPGLLFGFNPADGYYGLLENKRATIFYTSGVFHPNAEPKYGIDFQSKYLEWWLNLIGVNQIDVIRFQPSLLSNDPDKDFNKALNETLNLCNKNRSHLNNK